MPGVYVACEVKTVIRILLFSAIIDAKEAWDVPALFTVVKKIVINFYMQYAVVMWNSFEGILKQVKFLRSTWNMRSSTTQHEIDDHVIRRPETMVEPVE